jgi:RES domain-containing protein
MKVYRIALNQYCDVSGEGAKLYGGRWSFQGVPALYGSASISSSLLQRLTIDSELFSSERYVLYSVMEFDVPDKNVFIPNIKDLPEGWDALPPLRASQEFGSQLLQNGTLCFAVPSIVDKSSLNFVINPLADNFLKVTHKVYPLNLDSHIIR